MYDEQFDVTWDENDMIQVMKMTGFLLSLVLKKKQFMMSSLRLNEHTRPLQSCLD